jgi:hypothetical protein
MRHRRRPLSNVAWQIPVLSKSSRPHKIWPLPEAAILQLPVVSWLTDDDHDLFNNSIKKLSNTGSPTYYQTLEISSLDTASCFIMSSLLTEDSVETPLSGGNATITECQLHNAMKDVAFEFHSPKQTIKDLRSRSPEPCIVVRPVTTLRL